VSKRTILVSMRRSPTLLELILASEVHQNALVGGIMHRERELMPTQGVINASFPRTAGSHLEGTSITCMPRTEIAVGSGMSVVLGSVRELVCNSDEKVRLLPVEEGDVTMCSSAVSSDVARGGIALKKSVLPLSSQ
jgi:hypothetical protein